MARHVPTLVVLALLLGAGGYAVAGGTFSELPLEDPQVERFEQTASGCRGTVTSAGGATVGGNRLASFGVMETDSPNAACAGEVAYRLNVTVGFRKAMRVSVYEAAK